MSKQIIVSLIAVLAVIVGGYLIITNPQENSQAISYQNIESNMESPTTNHLVTIKTNLGEIKFETYDYYNINHNNIIYNRI